MSVKRRKEEKERERETKGSGEGKQKKKRKRKKNQQPLRHPFSSHSSLFFFSTTSSFHITLFVYSSTKDPTARRKGLELLYDQFIAYMGQGAL